MATATKIQLVEFNKDEALNGASLAFSSYTLVKYLLYALRSRTNLRVRGSYRKRLMLL